MRTEPVPYGQTLSTKVSTMCTIHPASPGAPVLADNRNRESAVVARACSPACRIALDLARDPRTRLLTPVRARNVARRAQHAARTRKSRGDS